MLNCLRSHILLIYSHFDLIKKNILNLLPFPYPACSFLSSLSCHCCNQFCWFSPGCLCILFHLKAGKREQMIIRKVLLDQSKVHLVLHHVMSMANQMPTGSLETGHGRVPVVVTIVVWCDQRNREGKEFCPEWLADKGHVPLLMPHFGH